MNKTNYHTHIKLCNHAEGMPIDYIKKAVDLNYEEIGIGDHGPLYEGWIHRMNLNQFYNIYLPSIDEAVAIYKNQIKIYKGLELEYLKGYEKHYEMLLKDLDYLILGQHVIDNNNRLYDIYREMNEENVVLYKDQVIEAMSTGYFNILAHPDLFLFNYQTWNELTEQVSHEIIEASIKYNIFLEVNANGIRRKPIINQDGIQVYIYPRIEFWQLVKEYPKAKVIIGEDNHKIKFTGDENVKKAYEFAYNLNLNVHHYLFEDHNE